MWTTEPAKKWLRPPPPPHVLPVTGICFTEVGDCLLTASADYTVAVWPIRAQVKRVGFSRIAFWALSFVISLFALFMAEDRHVGEGVRKRREVITPYLEPVLSNVRGKVRPVLNKGVDGVLPYLEEAKPYLWRVLGTAKKERKRKIEEMGDERGRVDDVTGRVNVLRPRDTDSDSADFVSESESSSINFGELKAGDSRVGDPDVDDAPSDDKSVMTDREDAPKPEDLGKNTSSTVREPSERSSQSSQEERPNSSRSKTEFSRIADSRMREKPILVNNEVGSKLKESSKHLDGREQVPKMSSEGTVSSEKTVQEKSRSRDVYRSGEDLDSTLTTDTYERITTEPRVCGIHWDELRTDCKVGPEHHSEPKKIEHGVERTRDKLAKIDDANRTDDKKVRKGEVTKGAEQQVNSCRKESLIALLVDFTDTANTAAKEFGSTDVDTISTVIETNVKRKEDEA